MHRLLPPFALLAASALLTPGAGRAQARLIASSPGAHFAAPRAVRVAMQFSDRLAARSSGGDILLLKGSKEVPVPSTAHVEPDGHTLILSPERALANGRYRVAWHALSGDADRTEGSFGFTVRQRPVARRSPRAKRSAHKRAMHSA